MPLAKIKYSYSNEVLVVFLDYVESYNAFDIEMAQELANLLDKENPKALVLSNTGSTFCSGGNLKYYKSLQTKEEGLAINQQIKSILENLDNLKIPKACFVQGSCFGGGIELISCFDRVYATPDSLFGLWQRRIGLSFGWGGGKRLLKRLSAQSLQSWLFEASTLSSYEALKRGLVDEVVLRAHGVQKAKSWVEKARSLGEESFNKTKHLGENEQSVFEDLWLSEKHKSVLGKFK